MFGVIAMSLSILTILAGLFMLAKSKKEALGKIYTVASYAAIVGGICLFLGSFIGGSCKMMKYSCGNAATCGMHQGGGMCGHGGGSCAQMPGCGGMMSHGGMCSQMSCCKMGGSSCGMGAGMGHHAGKCHGGKKVEIEIEVDEDDDENEGEEGAEEEVKE